MLLLASCVSSGPRDRGAETAFRPSRPDRATPDVGRDTALDTAGDPGPDSVSDTWGVEPAAWPSVGGSPGSTFSTELEGDATTLGVAWTAGDPDNAAMEFAPTVIGSRVLVGGDAGITALGLEDGSVEATLSLGQRQVGPPAVTGDCRALSGGLYLDVEGQPGAMHVVDCSAGLVDVWTVEGAFPFFGRPVVDGDHAWIAENTGMVYAVDLTADAYDAANLWATQLDSSPYTDLAVDEDQVYVGTRYMGLYALDRVSGAVRWRFALPEGTTSYSSATLGGSTAWYGRNCGLEATLGTCGALYRIDRATGEELCHVDVAGGDVRAPAAIGTDGVYVPDAMRGTLYKIDDDCGVVWTNENPDALPAADSAAVVVQDAVGERVLLLRTRSTGFEVVVMDAATGETLSEVPTGRATVPDDSGKNGPSLAVAGPWILTNISGSTVALRTD